MRPSSAGGFTYSRLIILVAIIGLVGAATLKVDALLRRAAAERELLEIGAAFGAALTSYADATPRGQPHAAAVAARTAEGPALSRRAPPPAQDLRRPDHRQRPSGASSTPAGRRQGQRRAGGVQPVAGQAAEAANFDARFQNLEAAAHLGLEVRGDRAGAGRRGSRVSLVSRGAAGQPGVGQPPGSGAASRRRCPGARQSGEVEPPAGGSAAPPEGEHRGGGASGSGDAGWPAYFARRMKSRGRKPSANSTAKYAAALTPMISSRAPMRRTDGRAARPSRAAPG